MIIKCCLGFSLPTKTHPLNLLQGTRSALYANDRESITVTVQEVTPRSVGALIALYERAVGIYASLVNINAYHQPGNYPRFHILCRYRIASGVKKLNVFEHQTYGN